MTRLGTGSVAREDWFSPRICQRLFLMRPHSSIKMAASIGDTTREVAFMQFEAEFERNGFGKVPVGLMRLLRDFNLKPSETPAEGRARLYKRLWCLLWYGSKQTLGGGLPRWPTYVYPETLKEVIRRIIAGDLAAYVDPDHDSVYHVNIGDLASAKWPAPKKVKGAAKEKKAK